MAGNRIGRFYNQVAAGTQEVGNEAARGYSSAFKAVGDQVVQYAEHREISHGAATFAQINDKLTQQWNDTAKNADPNDPAVADKFRTEVLEPTLDKYREGFITEGGQKFAESHVESLRNHMFTKTAADMSSLAAHAVSVNVRQTANSLSNTAITDPSAVPHLLASADSMVNGMIDSAPNLKGEPAARARMELSQKMKENIVKSGAIGAIQKSANPEAEAEKWSKKYPEYISGDEMKMLAANARQQIRARRTDEAYSEHLQEKAAARASDNRATQYLQKLYSDDPKEQGQISTKAIINDPTLTRKDKEHLIGVVNRELKPETATQESNRNTVDLLDRLRKPEGDPDRISDLNPIYDARIKGKINRTDFESLKKEFTENRTPEGQRLTDRKSEFVKAVTPLIDKSNPLMGKVDQDGALNRYRLMVDLDKRIDEYRKAGKNPYDLFDPAKPDYFGKPEALVPYQKPLQQSVRDTAARLTGRPNVNLTAPGTTVTGVTVENAPPANIAPRKPGESPAEYLKRTGSR